MKTPIRIFWFRRDLRLDDNHGLYKACLEGIILPVFIFDEETLKSHDKDSAKITYTHQALQKIQNTLVQLGKGLVIYHGQVISCWEEIIKTYNVEAVYFNKSYEPYSLKKDQYVRDMLNQSGISVHSFKDQVIFEENEILKPNNKPYTVFTPYKNKWLKHFHSDNIKPFPSESYIHNLMNINTAIPSLNSLGFKSSPIRVKPVNFDSLNQYNITRDFPALEQTSNLSVLLRYGTFSIRKAIKMALNTNEIWLKELIWRSFFKQILYHFPHVVNQPFKITYSNFPWRNNINEFNAWCKGETGYLMVDAGMRELNSTGYMHNRARMVCASFLCKHLLIDWRWGEAYFANKLLDYDLSANNGNWQWASSTGCDSVPYFRIFNPERQVKRFDPQLKYIKRWVKDHDQPTYPKPIIEHKVARERCLLAFKQHNTP